MKRPLVLPDREPLRTCPGRVLWEKYRGQEYLVFVDESFFEFFRLTARTGYFCHGAVGFPAREYPYVTAALQPLLVDYRVLVGESATEFKHSEFRRITYQLRHRLAIRLRDLLREHGAFVAGFFTPTRSYVLENVRFDLIGEAEELPSDCEELILAAANRLKVELDGPGASGLIAGLLQTPVAAFAMMLAWFECPFKLIYDPRDSREDRAVSASVEAYGDLLRRLKEIPGLNFPTGVGDVFAGFEHAKTSEEELGLQLADLMAGETKEFFLANPELMEFGASKRLVTARSVENAMTVTAVNGQLAKTGCLHRLPEGLQQRFLRPDPKERTVFPLFRELLASGIVTCYSAWGQPRHIMVFDRWIFDQLD